MIINLLAVAEQSGGFDGLTISAAAIIGLGTVATGIIKAFRAGERRGEIKSRITLDPPLPEFPTRKVSTPPTWDAHKALCDRVKRVEDDVSELRHAQSLIYKELMTAGAEREVRLGEKLDDIARGIHDRIDKLIAPNSRA